MVTETQQVNATAISPADSSMWIATSARGLVRVGKNGKAFNYSVEKGDLACNNIVALSFDNEGVLWIKDVEGAVLSYTSFTGFVKQSEVPQSIAEALSEPVLVAAEEVAPQPKQTSRPWYGSWWFLVLTILLLAHFIWRVFKRFSAEKPVSKAEPAPAPVLKPAVSKPQPIEPQPKPAEQKPAEPKPEKKTVPAAAKAPAAKPEITAPESGTFYEKVYTIVKDNYTNADCGVESVAETLGMSRAHLNRKLKAENKPSPSELIKKMRMDLAAEMLKDGGTSISEIASKCGFSSAAYFSSAFKEYFGVAPVAYGK